MEAVTYIVLLKYKKIDYSDAQDIACEIATQLVERFRKEPSFRVNWWPTYLGLLILDEYKKDYKDIQKHESITSIDEEDEEGQALFESIEMDTDSLVDMKHSVEEVYLTFQELVKRLPVESNETRNILERLIVFAATVDESIIQIIQEPYKRIVRAHYGQLRALMCKYKNNGLLISRQL